MKENERLWTAAEVSPWNQSSSPRTSLASSERKSLCLTFAAGFSLVVVEGRAPADHLVHSSDEQGTAWCCIARVLLPLQLMNPQLFSLLLWSQSSAMNCSDKEQTCLLSRRHHLELCHVIPPSPSALRVNSAMLNFHQPTTSPVQAVTLLRNVTSWGKTPGQFFISFLKWKQNVFCLLAALFQIMPYSKLSISWNSWDCNKHTHYLKSADLQLISSLKK